jgi:hypothetical protein
MRIMTFALMCLLSVQISWGESMSEFLYLIESEISMEGNPVGLSGQFYGRGHSNGILNSSPYNPPSLTGVWTHCGCDVFHESDSLTIRAGYDKVEFPTEEVIQAILGQASPDHRYPAFSSFEEPLTTWLKFDHSVYHVSQYSPNQTQDGDTTYHMEWQTFDLPQNPGLIWIEGVTRVQGIVAGQITLASSDSLFITGDLVTEDVILEPCWDPDLFGTVPLGSPNRIGLISEKDIIIAASLANGLGDGLNDPDMMCPDFVYDPVIEVCNQGRRDVIITAALLALGCTFEVEFWKTTAYEAPDQAPIQHPMGCEGEANTEVGFLDCPSAPALHDMRGTIWLCGSLCRPYRGFTYRNPPGPWGNAWIGHGQKFYRYDENFQTSGPPLWPETVWIDDDPLSISPSMAAEESCGEVEDLALFRQQWNTGEIYLEIEMHEEPLCEEEQAIISTWMDGELVNQLDVVTTGYISFVPSFQLPESGNHTLHIEVAWDAQVWNENGELCTWELGFTDMEEETLATLPTAIALSVFPNPFNPVAQVAFTLPAAGPVELLVYDLKGRLLRTLLDGTMTAGSHQVTLEADGLSSGLHFLQLNALGQVSTTKALIVK